MSYLFRKLPILTSLSAFRCHELAFARVKARREWLSLSFLGFFLLVLASSADAREDSSPVPFVLPERAPFIIPERSPVVLPEPKPASKPKEIPSESAASTSNSGSDASSQVNAASKPADQVSSSSAGTSSAFAVPASSSTDDTASTGASSSSVSPSGKRYLQGKTEHIDFKLNELDSYKQGMAALEKRNFAAAEILFKAAAAKLDDGYEKYRAECNFFEAKCLMLTGKADQAVTLLKSAVELFEQYDPRNPYKLTAMQQIADLKSGKARMDYSLLQGQTNQNRFRVSIDQTIMLYSKVEPDDSEPHLLSVEKEIVPAVVHNCFIDMTCLETAELGSNISNAVGRWQPLLVKGEPAAIEFGAKPPVINVKINGQLKEIAVNLPSTGKLRRVLLATDGEKVCAMDIDTSDTYLLQMEMGPDGNVGHIRWALLKHVKQKSATWGVSKGTLEQRRPTGNAWGTRQPGNNGYRGSGVDRNFYSRGRNRF